MAVLSADVDQQVTILSWVWHKKNIAHMRNRLHRHVERWPAEIDNRNEHSICNTYNLIRWTGSLQVW